MTQQHKAFTAPDDCTCVICLHYRDMEVIERAMARVDAMQRPANDDKPAAWIGWVIAAAFAVWLVAMLSKTGV